MTRTRWIALTCLLLSCGLSVSLGFFLERTKPDLMLDFKGVFFDAKCLLQHSDPYNPGEPLRAYLAEEGSVAQSADGLRQVLMRDVYLPTTSIFIAPFAMLSLEPAQVLWMILTAVSLVVAGYLIWSLGAKYAPVVSACLICLVLANSEVLFATGNPAGVAVSLCVVAAWCFLKDRFVLVGVLCLAISLAIKPHDAGLVWLYFLLAGGINRKRALQTLLITAVLGLAAIVWVTPISPHWIEELHSNLLAVSAPGGTSDPGLSAPTSRTVSMVIDLQSVVAVFRNDPFLCNSITYIVCGALLLAGAVRTLRSHISKRGTLLALAAIAPLTVLMIYHRPCDAKLLLLAVPACAMLWAEGGRIGRLALLVTTAGIAATADLPLIIFLALTKNLRISTDGLSAQMLSVIIARPVPLILLAMSVFYLWVYLRREPARSQP
ncbi:MAG: glycosyltransferase family 87 protein [Terracidiphilus sp.]